jgi:hypothetical protein
MRELWRWQVSSSTAVLGMRPMDPPVFPRLSVILLRVIFPAVLLLLPFIIGKAFAALTSEEGPSKAPRPFDWTSRPHHGNIIYSSTAHPAEYDGSRCYSITKSRSTGLHDRLLATEGTYALFAAFFTRIAFLCRFLSSSASLRTSFQYLLFTSWRLITMFWSLEQPPRTFQVDSHSQCGSAVQKL